MLQYEKYFGFDFKQQIFNLLVVAGGASGGADGVDLEQITLQIQLNVRAHAAGNSLLGDQCRAVQSRQKSIFVRLHADAVRIDDKNIYDEGFTVLCSNNVTEVLKEFDNVNI